MVSLRFEEYEAVTIRLSKEAFAILQEMQRKGLSPDDAVDSMILKESFDFKVLFLLLSLLLAAVPVSATGLWGILCMAGISLFVFLILAVCAWFKEREEYTHIRYLIRSEVTLFIFGIFSFLFFLIAALLKKLMDVIILQFFS